MDDLARMQVLQRLRQLIDDKFDMNLFKNTLSDYIVQICFHEFEEQIYVLVILGSDSLVKLNYVLVIDLSQYLYLSIGALCIRGVLEGVENLL